MKHDWRWLGEIMPLIVTIDCFLLSIPEMLWLKRLPGVESTTPRGGASCYTQLALKSRAGTYPIRNVFVPYGLVFQKVSF